MDALRRLLQGSTTRHPLPASGDDVFPVHMLDDTKTLREIVVTWTLRFNDVLDAEKLHASLLKLLEISDWRKIGGRLRLNNDGRLEIHVPRPFSTIRPAAAYSHQTLDVNIDDHPLAKTLPKATEGPSVQAGPGNFHVFAAGPNAPRTWQDFINTDAPQLSLHITSFQDATLVALSWPHTLMDVMGQAALLESWSLVLAGRESEVPPMLGAREDVICKAADATAEKQEEFKMGQRRLKGWEMIKFGFWFAWDMLWHPNVEARTIYLPNKVVAQLKAQAHLDLAPEDGGEKAPFISEGDVLTAWVSHAVASSLSQPRPVTILHALNARFRLSSLAESSGVYVQNMAVAAFTFLSAELVRGPLGRIAQENRHHLTEQSTEGQILAFLRQLRLESPGGGDPTIVCGESGALLMPFTNWTRANFFSKIDFSPAIVRAGEKDRSRSNPPGTMIYHHSQSMRQSPTTRNVVVVLGKDHGNNYWLTGFLLPAAWAKIEEEMKKM